MSDYDFSTLNDKEFEELVTDLLSAEYKKIVERFKAGKDSGIDGRFFELKAGAENLVIIQCKHWLKSGIKPLLNHCKNTEAAKVNRLSPDRYIFVTSLDLSPDDKDQISQIFFPYIKNTSDILGKAEVNALLAKYPEVERNHFKLWLASSNVLHTFLNHDVIGRSSFFTENFREFGQKYVLTINHNQAIKKLNELGCVIINGEPGIGKTTLAQQLCLEYILKEYELVVIEDSISEAEKVFHVSKKQIFYFDDFLGSNFLSIFQGREDSHIINFMQRVSRDKSKRFILTTRTNILNQCKRLSEKFEINHVDRNEYEIKLSSLTDLDKAKILYNHIWFSNLPEDFIDQIYFDKRYKEIINHKKFNPRLISFITDYQRLDSMESSNYWDYIKTSLDNPKMLWRGVLTNQISDLERHIVIATTINKNSIKESTLVSLLQNLKNYGIDKTAEYITVNNLTRSLVGSVLNRTNQFETITYSLFNPSIADFVISEYFDREDYILELVFCLRTLDSLRNLKKMCNEKIVNLEFSSFFSKILDKEKVSNIAPDKFTLELIYITFDEISYDFNPLFNKFFTYFPKNIYEKLGWFSLKLFHLVLSSSIYKDIAYIENIVLQAFNDTLDLNDFINLSKIISLIPNNLNLISLFKEKFLSYFSREATQLFLDSGYDFAIEDFELYYQSYVDDFIQEIIKELDSTINFNIKEYEELYYSVDEDEVVEHYKSEMESQEREDDSFREMLPYQRFDNSFNPIDDLFDRN